MKAAIKCITLCAVGILTSCAGEDFYYSMPSPENTFFSSHISYFTETTEDLGMAKVLFEETSHLISMDDETYILEKQLSATAKMQLEQDTILVETVEVPEIISEERSSKVCIDNTYYVDGKDIFSDSQSVEISAEWMYQFINENTDTTFFPHVKIDEVSFVEAEISEINDNLSMVTLKYKVSYNYDDDGTIVSNSINLRPYYFQKVVSKPGYENHPDAITPTKSYLTCDTTMIYDGEKARLRMIIWQVNETLLSKDSTEIDNELFVVASSGKLGATETLYVQNADAKETHHISNVTTQFYTRGNFTMKEKQTIYTWKASFDGEKISVYHQDAIVLNVYDISWTNGDTTFDITFDGEIKVVKNEMVYEPYMGDDYIKTRVLTVETLLEGHNVTSSTGKTVLRDHP